MSYATIGSALKTLLDTIGDFNVVYNYEPKELLKYPCGTVTASGHSDEFASTASNQRTFRFAIRLYYRTDTAEDAEGILRTLTDTVITTVEGDPTLSGACDFARPLSATWIYQEREVPVRVCDLGIECLVRLPR